MVVTREEHEDLHVGGLWTALSFIDTFLRPRRRQVRLQENKTRRDRTRQDRTRTRQDKTRQDKTRQDKEKDKTRHDRTIQDKTGQDKARQIVTDGLTETICPYGWTEDK